MRKGPTQGAVESQCWRKSKHFLCSKQWQAGRTLLLLFFFFFFFFFSSSSLFLLLSLSVSFYGTRMKWVVCCRKGCGAFDHHGRQELGVGGPASKHTALSVQPLTLRGFPWEPARFLRPPPAASLLMGHGISWEDSSLASLTVGKQRVDIPLTFC